MRTASELIADARRAGVEVTQRMIDEWQRAGLLPPPTRQKVPGQGRGRAPYQYPDHALDVVIWLGTHRRFIRFANGDAVARLWLRLEGYDYIDVDVQAVVLDRLLRLWGELRQDIPSLPNIAIVTGHTVTDMQRDALLDELDTNVTQRLFESGELVGEQSSFVTVRTALLGLIPPEWMGDPLADGETFAQLFAATFAGLDQPKWQQSLLAALLPDIIKMSRLSYLYKLISSGDIDLNGLLSALWRTLTPDGLPKYWSAIRLVSLFPLSGKDKPRDRADLMRRLDYDPLLLTLLALSMLGAAQGFSESVKRSIIQKSKGVSLRP